MSRTLGSDTELGVMWPRSGSWFIHLLVLIDFITSVVLTMGQPLF